MLDMLDILPTGEIQGVPTHKTRNWEMSVLHIATAAIMRLWEEKGLLGEPLLFRTKTDEKLYHPALLDKVAQRERLRQRPDYTPRRGRRPAADQQGD